MPQSKAKSAAKTTSAERRGPLTWIVSGLGLLVIVAAIAIVALDATDRATPPDLRVREIGRTTTGGVTRVDIEVLNLGGEAASAVELEGSVASGESSHVNLDYVAGRSHREATLSFPGNPGSVDIVVTGWTKP
ncbi:MAG: hypothetical protein EON90_06105 [Brevundimonas sp.]|nr:MAG: hypothetical protein EON90_06105 [Brevundimonas sp.]